MAVKPIYQAFIVGYERSETLGYTILKTRVELKLPLVQVADEIGVNTIRLSAIENDQTKPTDKELEALAKCLGLVYETLSCLANQL